MSPAFLQRHWFAFLLAQAFLVQALTILVRVGSVYQAIAIGLDAFWIGVIGGAFGILPAVLGLHLGRYIDSAGEKTAMVWGAVMMLAAALCLALVPASLAMLLVGSALMGAGQFIALAAQQSATSRTPAPQRARAIGHTTLVIGIAQAAGPLGISAFAGDGLLPDTGAIFLTCVAFCVICLFCVLLMRVPHRRPSGPREGLLQIARKLFGTPGFQLATYTSLVIFSAMDLLVIYLPLYAAEHGIGAGMVGVLLALRAASTILSRFFFDWLMRVVGRNTLLLFSLFMSGGPIGVLAMTGDPVVIGTMLLLSGLGLGLGAPLTLAWLADIVPDGMRGSAFSLRLAMNRVGQAGIPIVAGVIVGPLGLAGVFLAVSGSLLASAAIAARKLSIRR